MAIEWIRYNWRHSDDKKGYDYDVSIVGYGGVADIRDVTPNREVGYIGSDIYEVLSENGSSLLIYNPNLVKSRK